MVRNFTKFNFVDSKIWLTLCRRNKSFPYFWAMNTDNIMDINDRFQRITTFIFDYDGVMTDGKVYSDHDGHPWRATNVKDGFALQLATKLGYNVAVISGAICPSMEVRMNSLGVTDVFTAVPHKLLKLNEYMEEKGLKLEEIIFMGDDIPDLRVMQAVGLPACPADAALEVREISVYISSKEGGKGAVRDVIEQVLKVQGKWMTAEAYSW